MNKKTKEKIIDDIGEKRFEHSLRVRDTSLKLAEINGVDSYKAEIAALYHDCGKIEDQELLLEKAKEFDLTLDKYMLESKELIHAHLGARMAEEIYGIKDMDILNAIKYHTTGRDDMSMLEKVIYIADYIEPKRNFEGVEDVRNIAFKDINKALFMALNKTIVSLIEKGKLVDIETVIARNKFILKQRRWKFGYRKKIILNSWRMWR